MASGPSESKKIMRSSHSVPAGKTLINRLELQMDKRRKVLEEMLVKYGKEVCDSSPSYAINRGRYEGFAASIAVLRSSGVAFEIQRSNERLGIE